ncbi:MAG: hypothetical protein QNJ46_25795 [Leptolyngbyaceae cyanobacterium MO_188.B28]|nr:hypothetical protein [Leptolyngbyaceae cyanobacterium MO_188.B28]
MDIKQLAPIAAIALTAILGSSCSDPSHNAPGQGTASSNPAESPVHSESHSQSYSKAAQETASMDQSHNAHADQSLNTQNAASTGHNHDSHAHQSLEVSANQPIPSIDLIVHQDDVMGWNLEIQVANFRFAPENVNQESKTYEGHAHLYINGKKIARLYGPWRHVASLEPGENQVKVTLNANGHESLSYQGKEISDTETIQVPTNQ